MRPDQWVCGHVGCDAGMHRRPPRTLGLPIYLRNPICPRAPRGEGAGVPWSTTVLVN
jgi:hypothetical protein